MYVYVNLLAKSSVSAAVFTDSKLSSKSSYSQVHMKISALDGKDKTHCNKKKTTATRCNTLQHTAQSLPALDSDDETHCYTLQHTATRCKMSTSSCQRRQDTVHALQRAFQQIAHHANTLQRTARHSQSLPALNGEDNAHHNTLQHTATHCKHTAKSLPALNGEDNAHRNTLQHTAAHCKHIAKSLAALNGQDNTLQHTTTHCNTPQ